MCDERNEHSAIVGEHVEEEAFAGCDERFGAGKQFGGNYCTV